MLGGEVGLRNALGVIRHIDCVNFKRTLVVCLLTQTFRAGSLSPYFPYLIHQKEFPAPILRDVNPVDHMRAIATAFMSSLASRQQIRVGDRQYGSPATCMLHCVT